MNEVQGKKGTSEAENVGSAPWFLFDNGQDPQNGSALLLENAVRIIRADEVGQLAKAIEQLQQAVDDGLYAAGFFSYELGYALEPSLQSLMPQNRQLPLIWFALYLDAEHLQGAGLQELFERKKISHEQSFDQILYRDKAALKNIQSSWEKQDYLRRFSRAKKLIASGDIYQVNLTFKRTFEYQGAPFALYADLCLRQPVSYGAYLECADFAILSHSPELFFDIKNGEILTRPMKGTIRRGITPSEDRELSRELQGDIKNRAENLMIVDLMRNDLSRLCDVGSLEVSDLYDIAAFPTLYQMTSTVKGTLRKDVQLEELIKALIPAGSITGAPKIRAQEIISELEEQPRGVYCGAMGVISRDRQSGQLSALFNVAIRTLTLFPDGHGEAGIGSGVVQDSEGEAEYEECLLKSKFMTQPDCKLIETMRYDKNSGYYLLEHHLARLKRSAEELGFVCPLSEMRKELDQLSGGLENDCTLVRLLLSVGGQFTLTSTVIDCPDPSKIISFIISTKRVDSEDSLLAHKTTRREIFDQEWSRANKQFGAAEVLFQNQRGELTEGSRSTLFVRRGDQFLTPPLSCGLLPGTLRQQLIEEGRVVETVLTLDDLLSGEIFFGNSVRGLQPARLVEK